MTPATSQGAEHGGDDRKCEPDHGGRHVLGTVGCAQMKGDRTDRQQDEADRCGNSDRRPHQTDEHTGDPGEFARADQPPLQRLEPEVITDGQGL